MDDQRIDRESGVIIDVCRLAICNQFEAALSTINWCIESASSQVWDGPVARYPFSQVAFHSLFFTDYYLGADAADFQEQEFHLKHPEMFGDYEQLQDREPVSVYGKDQVRLYADFCHNKALTQIAMETEKSLATITTLTRSQMSRFDLYLYNIRHLQHHAAQLVLRLRLAGDADVPWIDSGWRGVKNGTKA